MLDEDKKITVGFKYIDVFGNEYESTSKFDYFDSMEMDELYCIGQRFNAFLAQCGFSRTNGNILMEDLSDSELEHLYYKLMDYREGNTEENDT